MAKILDGKKTRRKVLEELKPDIEKINGMLAPRKLCLAIVMVGDNPESAIFVKNKKQTGEKINIKVDVHHFSEDITADELAEKVSELGTDNEVHGIIIQLPLPEHIEEQPILDIVPLEKDVDVLGSAASGKFYVNDKDFPIIPSTLAGIIRLLAEYGITNFKGQNLIVVGQGKLVGKPAASYFNRKDDKDATVINPCSHTEDKKLYKRARFIISGAGAPGIIKGDMVRNGVIVVDAGTKTDPETGKIHGDVDFESVEPKASYITPVPGGVGPMTVAMIFYNLVQLEKQRLQLK